MANQGGKTREQMEAGQRASVDDSQLRLKARPHSFTLWQRAQILLATWLGHFVLLLVGGSLLISVAIAALVTLTTRVTEMLDVCQWLLRPLRRVGVDPDRVGLVLALTIRCIPLLVGIVRDVSDARKARGAGFSLRAMAAPAVVRALRSADAIGDALIARGVDD